MVTQAFYFSAQIFLKVALLADLERISALAGFLAQI